VAEASFGWSWASRLRRPDFGCVWKAQTYCKGKVEKEKNTSIFGFFPGVARQSLEVAAVSRRRLLISRILCRQRSAVSY
jgi:hypothetical protein